MAIFTSIVTILGPTFKLGLARMELGIPCMVKNFAIIVLGILLRTIITKLLLSVSLNISLPILTIIGLSTLLELLLVTFEKFIVTLPAYPGLNLLQIRYIDLQ